jgi:hypothetical protein
MTQRLSTRHCNQQYHQRTSKFLEEHRLAFHHRLGSCCANVAQAQHCGAVCDHSYKVTFGGVLIRKPDEIKNSMERSSKKHSYYL